MTILANFPLSYSDQVDVIEIFDGLTPQFGDAAHSLHASTSMPISSQTDLPDHGPHQGPSGSQ